MTRLPVGKTIKTIPGGTWNQFVGLLEREGQFGQPPGPVNDQTSMAPPHACFVRVVNKSGADVPEFGILGVDQPGFTPPTISGDNTADEAVLHQLAVECVEATEDDHAEAFVIAREPIANGDVGMAAIVGATWARVNVTDANHEFATVENSYSDRLKSAASGVARILWKQSGTGEKWCVVLLGGGQAGGSAHLVVPAETIPAAKRILTMTAEGPQWKLRLGTGFCYVYERDQSGAGNTACPQLDSSGSPVTIRVWNFCRKTYTPGAAGLVVDGDGNVMLDGNGVPLHDGSALSLEDDAPLLFAVQDHKGDYYITEDCVAVGSMSSSSSSASSSSASSSSSSASDGSSDSGGSDSASASDSGSGGSDSDSGGGGGCENGGFTGTIEYVIDVSWDEETCLLTVTKQPHTYVNGELCEVGEATSGS